MNEFMFQIKIHDQKIQTKPIIAAVMFAGTLVTILFLGMHILP